MAINNTIPDADFSPSMLGYSGVGTFKAWCQRVLPLTFDDSISYYELLNKVVWYINNLITDVSNAETNVTNLKTAYDQLQQYVNDYFDTLDVQQEINNKLDAMAESGELSTLLEPFVTEQLPGVVENQIDGVVADQIDEVVADQIDEVVADQLPSQVSTQAPSVITNWLNEHVNPVGSAVIVDDTLTISGAAADAKVTGDGIRTVQSQRIIGKTNLVYTDDYYVADRVCKTIANNQLVFTEDTDAFHVEIPVTAHDQISFPVIDNTGHGYVLAIVLENGNSSDQWSASGLIGATVDFISVSNDICTVNCDILITNRNNPVTLVMCAQYINKENFYVNSLVLGKRFLNWLEIPDITHDNISNEPINLGTLDGTYSTPNKIYSTISSGKLVESTNAQAFNVNLPLIADDTITLKLLNNVGYGYVVAFTDEELTAYNQFTYATLTDGTVRPWISIDEDDVATIDCSIIKRNHPTATRLIFCCKKANLSSFIIYSEALVYRYTWLGASPYDDERIKRLENIVTKIVNVDSNFPGGYYEPAITDFTDFSFGTTSYEGASADIFAEYDQYVDNKYCSKELLYTESSGLSSYVYKFIPKTPVIGQTTGAIYDSSHPTVIIVASQHGTERNAAIGLAYFVRDLMTNYENNPLLSYIRTSVNLIIVPVGNVYGFDYYVHGNANGVDINRNYDTTDSAVGWEVNGEPGDADYSGAVAGDQIETQAIQDLFEAYPNATLYIDFHTYGGATSWYQQNWHMLCQPPYATDMPEDVGKYHIQRQSALMPERYTFNLGDAPFIGYMSRDSRTGNSKIYARYIGVKNALVFEGTNKLPDDSASYSPASKKYCCELIGNYIVNSLAWMVTNY